MYITYRGSPIVDHRIQAVLDRAGAVDQRGKGEASHSLPHFGTSPGEGQTVSIGPSGETPPGADRLIEFGSGYE